MDSTGIREHFVRSLCTPHSLSLCWYFNSSLAMQCHNWKKIYVSFHLFSLQTNEIRATNLFSIYFMLSIESCRWKILAYNIDTLCSGYKHRKNSWFHIKLTYVRRTYTSIAIKLLCLDVWICMFHGNILIWRYTYTRFNI